MSTTWKLIERGETLVTHLQNIIANDNGPEAKAAREAIDQWERLVCDLLNAKAA